MSVNTRRSFRIDILHLFILFALSVAQPLFNLLSANAEFFVVRGSQRVDIVLLLILLCFGFPAGMALIESVAHLLSERLRRSLHFLFLVSLLSLLLLPLLNRSIASEWSIAVAILVAAVLAILIWRYSAAYSFLTFLLPALVAVPVLFLFSPGIQKLLAGASHQAGAAVKIQSNTPVVMVVFDEFPVISLLEDKKSIDEVRFPNFARLMRGSTWFRNASTVSIYTTSALPAILTGRYPHASRLPTLQDYPENLFTLLDGKYDLHVFETATRLSPQKKADVDEPLHIRLRSMISDLSAVYLHLILPQSVASELPAVNETWGDFWQKDQTPENFKGEVAAAKKNRKEFFDKFLSSITATSDPSLYFLHVMLPHKPWKYFPTGREYKAAAIWGAYGQTGKKVWEHDTWAIQQSFQRHLLQLGYVDHLLGLLIEHLKKVKLYDRSLLIVTADHGIAFVEGQSVRSLVKSNIHDILLVPLFVKKPGQTRGEIVNHRVQTIDIVPTIAETLQVRVPWKVDGVSLFQQVSNSRERVVIFRNHKTSRFQCDISDDIPTFTRKLKFFGSRTGYERLFRIGPSTDLIGTQIGSDRLPVAPGLSAELEDEESFSDVKLSSNFVPALVTGQVHFENAHPQRVPLAVAVNGVVRATTYSFAVDANTQRFAALVPDDSFRNGTNEISLVLLGKKPFHIPIK